MLQKAKALFLTYREPIAYLFFGGLTTLVNFAVYLSLRYLLFVPMLAANGISWVVAVLFAYLTNKIWVFENRDFRAKVLLKECGSFVACRIFSGVVETLMLLVFVDYLHLNDIAVKVIAQIVVIVLNYIFSKLFIFRKSKEV